MHLRHHARRLFAAMLAFGVCVTASATEPPLAADQYIRTQATRPARLEAFDGGAGRELPNLPDLGRFDASRDSARLCASDYDGGYLLYDLRAGRITASAKAPESGITQPAIDPQGRCLVVLGAGRLGLLRDGMPPSEIALPDAGDQLPRLSYSVQARRFIAQTQQRIYLIRLDGARPEITAVAPAGELGQLRASAWLCCAQLSPDGGTLYTIAAALDQDLTGHTLLAAVDVSSGRLRRAYLPRSSGEDSSRYTLSGGSDSAFALSRDGKSIYIAAIVNGEQLALLRIDTASGAVSQVRKGSADPLLADSDGYLLLGQGGHRVEVARLPDGQTLRTLDADEFRPLHP